MINIKFELRFTNNALCIIIMHYEYDYDYDNTIEVVKVKESSLS